MTCCLFCFGCGTDFPFHGLRGKRHIHPLKSCLKKQSCCHTHHDNILYLTVRFKKEVKTRCDERTFSQGQFGWNSVNIHANPSQIPFFVH